MSYWTKATAWIMTVLHALAHALARGIAWTEGALRAGLRLAGALLRSAVLLLGRTLVRVARAVAARLADAPRMPAGLRQPLLAFQTHSFTRDGERLALWWSDWRHEALRAGATPLRRSWISLTNRYGRRQMQRVAIISLLIITVLCGPLSVLGALHVISSFGQSGQGTPHHFDPKAGTQSTIHLPPAPKVPAFSPKSQRPPMPFGFVPSMKPGLLPLDPAKDVQFVGSDGRLEVDAPAGAVNAADVKAAPGGAIALRLSEMAPASGSSAGGSGIVSLGSYLAEVVDGKGNRLAHGLRKPVTVKLHYGPQEQAFNLDQAFVVFNGAHPRGITGLGPYSTKPATHDRANHLLVAQIPADPTLTASAPAAATASTGSTSPLGDLLGTLAHALPFASASHSATAAQQNSNLWGFTFNSNTPVAKFGGPDPLSVELTSGSLTEGIQLDVPPGPAQAMPNLTLAYNSGNVSEQHSPQGAAGWVGEGWTLNLGEISWAERDVQSNCTTCSAWRNSWYLNDPFGTSTELVPPVTNVSTNYDDTGYTYCATGNANAVPCPIQFQTARESYARVYAYRGPLNNIGTSGLYRACWRVYLPNGVMEEFGCTPDSVQYYPMFKNGIPGGTSNVDFYYFANWHLDLITNAQGDQVHITYQSDTENATDPATNTTKSYPRDIVPSTIEWDSPDCVNASQQCTGTTAPNAWHPHYRVSFSASHHTVSRLTNSPSGCNTDPTVRCDDPWHLTGSNQIDAPLVNSTFVLNDAYVQTNTTGNGGGYNGSSWNTVRDYQFSYEQSGPSQIVDTVTGKSMVVAGYLDLTKLQEVGDDGSTSYPAQQFGYTSQTEYYEDGTFTPYSSTYCGPSWNTGGNGGTCPLWWQTFDGNSRYLSSISNGQGLAQTISWFNARNNTHGVNSGGSPADPTYCNSHQFGYPCNEADDWAWSRASVAERDDSVAQVTQNGQGGQQTNTTVTSRSVYTYTLTYPLTAQQCTDCVAGMYWGSENSGDYLDYYNPQYMGYAQTAVSKPDGSLEIHHFYSTLGWGVWDTNGVTCSTSLPPVPSPLVCHNSPWWNVGNAGHGLETEAFYYDTNGTTLLKHTTNSYTAVCPPSGVGASQSGNWNNESVDEVGWSNPVAVCDVQRTQSVTEAKDGTSNTASDTIAYTYDNSSSGYGRLTQATSTASSGGSSPTTVVAKTSYTAITSLTVPGADRNNTSQEASWSGGLYKVDLPSSSDIETSGGTQSACSRTSYDTSTGNPTEQDSYTGCAGTPAGQLKTTYTYDNAGNLVASNDPDANAGISGHTGCTDGITGDNSTHTICTRFNDSLTQARLITILNANSQSTTLGYATTSAGGFGLWPTQVTDPNGQVTTTAYDALGRVTGTTLPGEGTGLTTTSASYTVWCSGTSAQTPCVEVDGAQRLDSSHTVTARSFYDGAGRLIETRTSAPGGQDVVAYTLYNAAGQASTASVKYFVTAYTGAAGSAAYSIPDNSQVVTTATYDGLDRTLRVTDPLSNVTQAAYSVVCSPAGTNGDTSCYEQTLTTDANNHEHGALADGFGRSIYDQAYSGNSGGTYALYATTKTTYDTDGRVTAILHPDGVTQTTDSYDTTGRVTSMSDPDRGSETYSYDQNGNATQTVDARGASGTIYAGYDGLNRQAWRNTTNSPTGAYVTYSYDSTASGNNGVGRLTGETFNGGNGGTALGHGSYGYTYDARGQTTAWSLTLGGTNYSFGSGFNDAGEPTSLTYSDGEVLSFGYDSASGALTSLITTPSGGSATNLVTNISYSGAGGAAGAPTGASVAGGVYTYSASYDLDTRLSSLSLVNANTSTTLFSSAPGYDAASNVTSVSTTLAAGTDNQAFCYDEQDRLVWAGAAGTPACGSALTPGSLTSAQYTQTFGYDTLDRLTSGPLGSYTYGDSAHKHAVTSIGTSSYTASYDASGNMTCRAPSGSQTCSGTPTGQLLTYDNEGRTTAWQNAPSNPTSIEQMAYDGEGRRVALTVNGGTPTYYLGSLQEISGGSLTKYLSAAGLPSAVRVGTGGALSYLASDGLGSISETLDGSGNVSFQQLFTPYGGSRYTSGTSPTTFAFTGQRADAASGLDYYGARYYDPSAGQFGAADSMLDGLNRFGYVGGNPTTFVDPSGHETIAEELGGGGGAASSATWAGCPRRSSPPQSLRPHPRVRPCRCPVARWPPSARPARPGTG